MRTKFNVLEKLTTNTLDFNECIITSHFRNDRIERHYRISRFIGDGKCIASFLVDTDHPNGYEEHNIFDNGIIIIRNYQTERVVTELIARPAQIKRYWFGLGVGFPRKFSEITDKAYKHELWGWNNW